MNRHFSATPVKTLFLLENIMNLKLLPVMLIFCMLAVPAFSETDCSVDLGTIEASPPLMLSLEAAQRRALADNPDLQAVEMRVRQAGERVRQSRAAFFPTVDLDWNAVHTELPDSTVREARDSIRGGFMSTLSRTLFMPVISPLTTGSTLATSAYQTSAAYQAVPESVDNYSVSVSVGYALFTGFARKHAYALARFGEKETAAAADEARRLMLEAVAQTYYGAQLANERVTITVADKEFNTRLLKEAHARNKAGAASRSEVLNFEVRSRASEAQHISALQDFRLALIALASLMGIADAGLPEGTVLTPLEPADEPEFSLPDYDALYENACALRPDLEGSRYAVDRSEANVGLQQASYYPTVAAFASKEASRSGSGNFEGQDVSDSIGVNLSYNLFSGGKRRAAVAEARQAHKEAGYRLQAAEIAVAQDVREALVRLQTAQEQLRLQMENAAYVQENRDMVQKEFQAGLTSLALLNQAQRDLVEAQATLALARVSLLAAWHSVRTATGETLSSILTHGEAEE